MKSKKCLVIGANSFVGSVLISHLKNESEVVGIYHKNRDKLFSDITNRSIEELELLDTEFDQVFIVGAFIPKGTLDSSDRKNLYQTNVSLVDQVCSKFYKSRIVYCSSISVYKVKNSEIFEEDTEGGLNEYGVSKLWGEKIVQACSNYAVFRISSIYGEGMRLESIIPHYIKQAITKQRITVWGQGSRMQNYIHVSDVVRFLIKGATHKTNGTFLATNTESISNINLAKIIARQTNSEIVVEGQDDSPSFWYNNQFSREELGYSPQISIESGINELIKWIERKS